MLIVYVKPFPPFLVVFVMVKVFKRYCIHVKVGSKVTDQDPHEYPLIWHGSVSGSRSKEITKIFKKSDFHLFKKTSVLAYVGMLVAYSTKYILYIFQVYKFNF
jgi:hypothetical protein